jgi:hypothetical protein
MIKEENAYSIGSSTMTKPPFGNTSTTIASSFFNTLSSVEMALGVLPS